MVQIWYFNALDLFLLFVLFIGIMIGFMRGPTPQIISLASIWFGLLATLWTYRLLSINILQGLDIASKPSDIMAFWILLIVFFNIIRLIVKSLTTSPEDKKKKPKKKGTVGPIEDVDSVGKRLVGGPVHVLGGMIMGFVLTTIWIAIIFGVMQFTFQVNVSAVPGTGVTVSNVGMANQIRTSFLMPYFNQVLWVIVKSLELFVLDPTADILSNVVSSLTTAPPPQ